MAKLLVVVALLFLSGCKVHDFNNGEQVTARVGKVQGTKCKIAVSQGPYTNEVPTLIATIDGCQE